ncbi:DUF1398 family protein [Streptococcus parauberis]|uniref:DUF1398 family protein n=1 Tax=Streptococcus parauberis TaxID=1348 RepID=UPI0002BB244D|nr:DUF1398 family protein [Streptococcus parauberis]EMF49980.1 hypothetical protein SPJ2_0800 [Streptococcus parauberis KRS-02109]UWM86161.1 DUF1398 family protein [Streptococcus parauberis]UWM88132.1 DUF1398 family protein [Streptococcus parauberis]WEM58969.1 DUF1398 family protein [Streptococcus parauberis]
MITKDAITKAQEEFGGRNFPMLVQAFLDLGMVSNTVNIKDGKAIYNDKDDNQVAMAAFQVEAVAENLDKDYFMQQLKLHQSGQTDFSTFCKDTADAGIYKWDVDLLVKTCTYFDLDDQMVYSEPIPV